MISNLTIAALFNSVHNCFPFKIASRISLDFDLVPHYKQEGAELTVLQEDKSGSLQENKMLCW